MPAPPAMLAIGDFSRATLLTIKTLRHYHDTGLLEAAEVDPQTGYRRYLTSQIPQAQMIKRFRELQMPLNEIGQLLASPDGSTRYTIIAAHLRRLENDLGRTRSAVSELRALLGPPAGLVTISHRHIASMLGAAIGECVDQSTQCRGWRARWQSCIRHSLPRADEPSPQRADSSRTSSSPKGEVRQRSTFPVMGPLKVSVAYDPTNRLRSSLPQSYTQARIEVSTSPMEPWRLTWRVMNLPRTGPCGSSTWWDRWILRTRAPGVRRSVGPSRLDRISQRLPVLDSRRQSSFALEHELEGRRPY